MIKMLIILIEGLHFLWVIRDRHRKHWWLPLPSQIYFWWRLGTVYGLQPIGPDGYPDGKLPPKTYKDLLHDAWRDRESVAAHLLWRRQMRKQRNRPTKPPRLVAKWLN